MIPIKYLQNRFISVLILILLFSSASYGQVTIGSAIHPVQGSLLDLKETESLEANSTKGLMLPRVSITQLKELKMGDNNIKNEDNDGDQFSKHIGLMVYNVNNNLCSPGNLIAEGVYVWTGESWMEQTGNVAKLTRDTYWFTDNRDNQSYLAREFYYIDDNGVKVSAGDWMLQNLAYNPILNPAQGFDDFEQSLGNKLNEHDEQYAKAMQKLFYYAIGSTYDVSNSKVPSGWNEMIENGILYSYNAAINGYDSLALKSIDQGQATPLGDAPGKDEIEMTGPLGNPGHKYIRGICPEGWHLPSDREWNELERAIYNNPQEYSTISEEDAKTWPKIEIWNPDNGTNSKIGQVLKSVCSPLSATSKVIESNGKSYYSRRGGFNALLVGTGSSDKIFPDDGTYFWTSSKSDHWFTAYIRELKKDSEGIRRNGTLASAWNLLSVRCKKD